MTRKKCTMTHAAAIPRADETSHAWSALKQLAVGCGTCSYKQAGLIVLLPKDWPEDGRMARRRGLV